MEAHPGAPADLPRGDEMEAVSPKSDVPGGLRRQTESTLRWVDAEPNKGRLGSSLAATKSPYPLSKGIKIKRRVGGWMRRIARCLGR